MTSLTRKCKRAETAVFKRVAARLSFFASRLVSAVDRIARDARQGLTILIVEDSAKPPKGVRISYFSLALGCAGAVALVALTVFFSFGARTGGARIAGSGSELAEAKAELDRFREGASGLATSYAALNRPLASIAAVLDKPRAKMGIGAIRDSMTSPSRVSGARSETKRISEASAGLEASIASLEELGKAAASMNVIKQEVPALWPIKGSVGHLSATYGPNPDPFTGLPYFHKGIDCSNYGEGDPIVATAEGTVVFAGVQGGYGRSVVVSHPNGYFTRYGHMQRIIARRGQAVKQGQTIGIVGNTGRSTGPHTHYEVMIGDELVDPIDYLWSKEDRKAPEGTIPFGME